MSGCFSACAAHSFADADTFPFGVLGISIKTVEARLSRALQELHAHLKDFL